VVSDAGEPVLLVVGDAGEPVLLVVSDPGKPTLPNFRDVFLDKLAFLGKDIYTLEHLKWHG
jgi:hypothetical protein